MVGTGRFELPTCRLGGDRSIHLSYVPTLPRSIVSRAGGRDFTAEGAGVNVALVRSTDTGRRLFHAQSAKKNKTLFLESWWIGEKSSGFDDVAAKFFDSFRARFTLIGV